MKALDAKTDGLTVSSDATCTSLSLYFGFHPGTCFSCRSLLLSLARLILLFWRQRQQDPLEYLYLSTRLHDVTSQKIYTAEETSNLRFIYRFLLCTMRASDILRPALI
jgi:hypothetical protein